MELFLHFDIVWSLFYVTSNEAAHPNGNQQEAHLRFLPFVFPRTKVSVGEKYEKGPGPLALFKFYCITLSINQKVHLHK